MTDRSPRVFGVLGAAALAAVLLSAACGGGADGGRELEIVERDSAGITIVENPPWEEAAPFAELSATPELSLGTLDGDETYQFFGVRDLHRYPDGRLAVANSGSHEVRFYTADGTYLDAVGGEGEGPGEFRGMSSLWPRPADTLWVYDSRNRTFTVLGPQGDFSRAFALGSEAFASPSGIYRDGAILVSRGRVFRSGEERSGLDRTPEAVEVYGLDGALERELGEWAGNEAFVTTVQGGLAVRGLTFGRQQFTALSGERAVVGENDGRSFFLVGRDGSLERIVRVAGSLRPVEAGAFEQVRDEALEQSSSDELRDMWRDMFDAMPRHETYPAYRRILVDAARRIWLEDYAGPSDVGRTWTVFDPDGRMLGRVEVPEGLLILDIGADYVAGVYRDELEVEHVQLYGLETAPPPGDR